MTRLGCMKTLIMFPRVLRINTGVKKGDFYVSCVQCVHCTSDCDLFLSFTDPTDPAGISFSDFQWTVELLGLFLVSLQSVVGTLCSVPSFILKVVIFYVFYTHRVAANFNTSPHICHLVAVICFIGVETELEKDMTRCHCLV